jgi:hypothetical protein
MYLIVPTVMCLCFGIVLCSLIFHILIRLGIWHYNFHSIYLSNWEIKGFLLWLFIVRFLGVLEVYLLFRLFWSELKVVILTKVEKWSHPGYRSVSALLASITYFLDEQVLEIHITLDVKDCWMHLFSFMMNVTMTFWRRTGTLLYSLRNVCRPMFWV